MNGGGRAGDFADSPPFPSYDFNYYSPIRRILIWITMCIVLSNSVTTYNALLSYASDCLVFLQIIQESRLLMVAIIIDLEISWSHKLYHFLYFAIFSHISTEFRK